jgi:prepilin-type N-terminal cleavage/methylation domain-containing protein
MHSNVKRIKFPTPRRLNDNKGFTLLEMIIVMVIISIMALLIAPRLTDILGSRRGNFIILTSIIAKTFDDSFIRGNVNFLIVHLYEPDTDSEPGANADIFSRRNGISVVNLDEEGKFIDSKNKLLQFKGYPSSFKIEKVLLSTGEKITQGNVIIPFYPNGNSDDVIVHILVNDEEQWSLRMFKLKKEAHIAYNYIDFEGI